MFKLSVLPTISKEEAEKKQFELVECISQHFSGTEFLSAGDYGVTPQVGGPIRTRKIERVLAQFFGTEDCTLVRGSGTGGIRLSLSACLEPGDPVMMYQAPIYTTTKETVRLLGLKPVFVDYHDHEAILSHLNEVQVVYLQHSRQQIKDEYDVEEVIRLVKKANPEMIIIVDDNYTVFKVPRIGVQLGADISTFSGFKVLGPEGMGVVVGKQKPIQIIRERNYSGGGQVQGPEAMELLRSLVYAPVLYAIQNEQVGEIARRMNHGEIPGIESAQLSNAQSRNVIAKLKEPIADQVIKACDRFGAAIYPVGAESKYEVLPMVYRVSGAFLESNPELSPYLLRINPMRSGADLVINILKKALEAVKNG
jgi:cystathionine beta-lyase family protein involved in aluminum resistance